MHSSGGSVGAKTLVAGALAAVLVGGIVAVAVKASENGSSSPANNQAGTSGSTEQPGNTKNGSAAKGSANAVPPDYTGPASNQSCVARLGKSAGKLPKALPRPPGATFDGIDRLRGLYAGYLGGTQPGAPAAALRTAFVNRHYQVSPLLNQETVSKFAFQHKKLKGVAYVAVLCKGNLRVEYQLVLPPSSSASPAPVRPTTTPSAGSR